MSFKNRYEKFIASFNINITIKNCFTKLFTISQEETKTIGLIFLDSIKMLEVDNLLELVIIEILINRAMPWPYRENYMLSRAITFFFFKSKVSDKEKYLSERE